MPSYSDHHGSFKDVRPFRAHQLKPLTLVTEVSAHRPEYILLCWILGFQAGCVFNLIHTEFDIVCLRSKNFPSKGRLFI